jgi:hypothetical protein
VLSQITELPLPRQRGIVSNGLFFEQFGLTID